MNRFVLLFIILIYTFTSCHDDETFDSTINFNLSDPAKEIDMDGDTLYATIQCPHAWSIQNLSSNITLSKSQGEGTNEEVITIFVDTNFNKKQTIELIASIDEAPEFSQSISFEQEGHLFDYEGDTYSCYRMKDGRIWMCENLRYIPEGFTPSSDPTQQSHIWYTAYGQNNCTPIYTEPDSVRKYGLLYDALTALGISSIQPEDIENQPYEEIQGIAPDGWHIPSAEECKALWDAYYDEANSTTHISSLNNDHFNWNTIAMRKQNNPADEVKKYVITGGFFSSSIKRVSETGIFMNVFTFSYKVDKILYNDGSAYAGYSVRCIKNK